MDREFSLILPAATGGTEEIKTNTSFLFIGANGSGKTRLGTWIEMTSTQKEKVHRISAQKSLSMPDTTTPMSIERAEKNLLFGNVDGTWNHKIGHKWRVCSWHKFAAGAGLKLRRRKSKSLQQTR